MPLTTDEIQQLKTETPAPNRLRAAMRLAKVTQLQVAEAVGVSQSHVSEIANGNYTRLPLETSRKLAAFFGCDIEDLFPSESEAA